MTALTKAAVTTISALALAIVVMVIASAFPLSGEGRHAVGHVAPGVAALFLAVAVRNVWSPPRPARASRVARMILWVGLLLFGTGQIVEGVGAFGYSGYARVNSLAVSHDLGVMIGLVGLLLALTSAVFSGFTALATRRGSLTSRRVMLVIAAAVTVVVLYVVAGIMFGF